MFSKVLKIFSDVIFVLSIIFLVVYFILRFMGIAEIFLVKTGSMEDGIHVGDYILIYKKDNYNIGDIVTYEKDGYHVTHRIIKKNGNKIVTKGDANNIEDDEINVRSIVGKVIYSGGYLNFVIDYKYAIASVLLALYLFSCYFSKKDDEINEDNFLLETNKEEDATENDILSEEKNEEILEEGLLEKNNKEEIAEKLQSEEKDSKKNVTIKQDLSFIYENNKKQEKNNKKKKGKK